MHRRSLPILSCGLAAALLAASGLLNQPILHRSPDRVIAADGTEPALTADPSPALARETERSMVPDALPSLEDDAEQTGVLISSLTGAEVIQWLDRLYGPELTDNAGRLLLRRWMELDPASAADWVARLDNRGAKQDLAELAAVAWAETDFPAALRWAKTLEEDARPRALAGLASELARTDAGSALQMASELPASESAEALIVHAAAQFASADPDSSQAWALSLPPGSLRERCLSAVATALAGEDGEAAAQFAVMNLSPGPDLDRVVIAVIQRWAQNNPGDASAWAEIFPDSPVREQALQTLDRIAVP